MAKYTLGSAFYLTIKTDDSILLTIIKKEKLQNNIFLFKSYFSPYHYEKNNAIFYEEETDSSTKTI